MDRIGKNLGVIVLGVLVFIAALIYGRNRLAEREKEETEDESHFPFERIYATGEQVLSVNVVCQVNHAEIFTDYEELESFYKKRRYLAEPRKYLMQNCDLEGVFPEEIRFIHLNFSLTNHSKMKKIFVPDNLELTSISDNYKSVNWGDFFAYDGQYQIEKENGETQKLYLAGRKPNDSVLEYISILPEETAIIDFVGEFLVSPKEEKEEYFFGLSAKDFFEQGELYLSISGLGTEISTGHGLSGEKIRLNVSCPMPSEKRMIQEIKGENWTNLERSQEQKNSYSFASVQEDAGYPYIEIMDADFQNGKMIHCYKKTTRLLGWRLIDWADLPNEYVKRGNLQQMAKRYKEVYGYETEELKVLFLDMEYSAEVIGNGCSSQIHNFYINSILYLKKNEKEWSLFGTADEWKITENSLIPQNIGFLDSETLGGGGRLRAELIYILPPDIYRQQKELYFFGSLNNSQNPPEEIPITKISL